MDLAVAETHVCTGYIHSLTTDCTNDPEPCQNVIHQPSALPTILHVPAHLCVCVCVCVCVCACVCVYTYVSYVCVGVFATPSARDGAHG